MKLLQDGAQLIVSHTNTRMPMPKSTTKFMDLCETFREKYASQFDR